MSLQGTLHMSSAVVLLLLSCFPVWILAPWPSLSSNHYHHALMMPEMSSKQSVGVVLLPPPRLCGLISALIKESMRHFLLMKRYRFLSSSFNCPSDCIITMMVDFIITNDGRSFIVVLVTVIMLKVDLFITHS